ncbi:MAG TPA: GAF domain-containing protein [Terriglobales bacterium]|nr:GAF domain-containing protein [Terriglobales bacterium]
MRLPQGAQVVGTTLPAEAFAVLALLAANLLVFRTFRERYFLTWIVGWLAYVTYRVPVILSLGGASPPRALADASFILAIFLLSSALLLYSEAPRLVLPTAAVAALAAVTVVMKTLWWPHSTLLSWMVIVLIHLITAVAALQLLRYTWARWTAGPWILALTLVLLQPKGTGLGGRFLSVAGLPIDLWLGVSMLMIVFDESRLRTLRLGVVNNLASAIAQAQDANAMLLVALQELKHLMRVRAAWFRVLEGEQMVLTQHVGLSLDFLKAYRSRQMNETLTHLLHTGEPCVQRVRDTNAPTRETLRQQGFEHLLLIPVRGKKSVIGVLALAGAKHRSYSTDDLAFLKATANQVGIAAENLRLFGQIRRSQREWISTFDSMEDFILVHDSQNRIMKVNRALLRRLERAPAEVISRSCEEVLPRGSSAWQGCPYCGRGAEDLVEEADPCFGGFSLVSTSSYVWTSSYREEARRQLGTVHIIRDTTDRRTAEEKYRQLFEQVQEGVFVADAEGKLLDCNHALVGMLGYENRQELLALSADALYASPEQRITLLETIQTRSYVRSFEVQLRKKDGNTLSASETSFATRDEAGEIARYQGFLLDVTEKKRAEDEIRRRNLELHALNAIAVVATQSFDLDEILNLTLRQLVTLFAAETGSVYLSDNSSSTLRRRAAWGHRSSTAIRSASTATMPAEFWQGLISSRRELITQKDLPSLPAVASDFVNAEGLHSWMWVILWSQDQPIGVLGVSSRKEHEFSPTDEKLMVAIGRQLATTIDKIRLYEETTRAYDDLRRTQEQLLQSEKMSAIGQLIAGVAHELNNPLTAILGYAQLLESEPMDERCLDFVRKLLKQAQRTHRLVQNLLSFARQRTPQKIPVDIRRVVDDSLALRDYDFKRGNILVQREIAEELPAVTADPHQLEQVFLNIINNAVDAMLEMERGGVLSVRVYAENGAVYVEFRDTGRGIADPKRIFDPFYTTKPVGKGTGLGLSICYGILKEHGGEIEARNVPEGGAALLVRLPAAGKPETVREPSPPPARELVLSGRLLLVDDEEAVLEFEREVLAGAGAEVVTASEPEKARDLLNSGGFDAVILNGSMPNGWNAVEIHGWLCQHHPRTVGRVLFIFSTLDGETQTFLEQKRISYLVKPFDVADLIASSRKLLQKAAAATASS